MNTKDFYFDLPKELIAQYPAAHREDSRMMLVERETGDHKITGFTDIEKYLEPGDCLVINDTKVIQARLYGNRPTGGHVEAFLLEQRDGALWQALLKPGRRLPAGSRVILENAEGASFTVEEKCDDGTFLVRFDTDEVLDLLERFGRTPLPPYIDRKPDQSDKERYQTVYAKEPGAVAAPTAGLHFTKEMLDDLQRRGIKLVRLTLHVGAGTFKPVKVEKIEDHVMHEETYILSEKSAEVINETHRTGHRVFCVGTTTVRTLESCAIPGTNLVKAASGRTHIFLYPPKKPAIADGLLTNFHLPESTLLMLISCFCDREKILAIYKDAVDAKMRFFSYGDCMLMLPPKIKIQ